jgi:hypothetical protein
LLLTSPWLLLLLLRLLRLLTPHLHSPLTHLQFHPLLLCM